MKPAIVYADEERDGSAFVREVLVRLRRGVALSEDEASRMMRFILMERVSVEEIVQFLGLLARRGPTASEIVGSATALRAATTTLRASPEAMDNCGTGGDGATTFNISTVSALVAAAAGQPIVKHGNRSSSEGVGSADLLEALGVPLELDEAALLDSLSRHRFAFLFAPRFRPAAHRIRAARRLVAGPTLFNLLGPLCNPARPAFQVIGTFSENAARNLAEAVLRLGTRRAFIVVGPGGVDEMLPQDGNLAFEVVNGTIRRRVFDAQHAGLQPCSIESLRGGSARDNARTALGVLSGETGGPRDAVIINAGLTIYTAGRAESLRDGCEKAASAVGRGTARDLLMALQEQTERGANIP